MKRFLRLPRTAFLPALIVLVNLIVPPSVSAHETRPGYLELNEIEPERYDVLFKVPALGGARLRMYATLPGNCVPITPTSTYPTPSAFLERSRVDCDGGLTGQLVAIQGLETLLTDVLVRIQPLGGALIMHRLRPNAVSFIVPSEPPSLEVAGTYLTLGIEHILGGIDHLLFVLALLLKTITAFTIVHSITLVLATLGFVSVPGAPVEAVIALSILFLASEIIRGRTGRAGLTERYPWVVAFTFGLLHGLGFCRRIGRGRPAAIRHPAGPAPVQRRCRDRTGDVRRGRVSRSGSIAAGEGRMAGVGVARARLRHRFHGRVLVHSTRCYVLVVRIRKIRQL